MYLNVMPLGRPVDDSKEYYDKTIPFGVTY